jgi:hypothetical protein
MKKLLQIFVTFLLVGSITFAQAPDYPRDVIVCWTHPTDYELLPGQTTPDPIQDGDLANTRITGERQNAIVIIDELVPVSGVPGSAQCKTFVAAIPQPGTYTFFAYSITVDDISSDASNMAVKKYTGKPQPPNGLGVQ